MDPSGERITTIRISGLPSHTREADFNCWFLFAADFEQATLAPGQQGCGWARFRTIEAAQAAIDYLNGLALTPDMSSEGVVLKAELANKNFKPRDPNRPTKRPREEPLPVVSAMQKLLSPHSSSAPSRDYHQGPRNGGASQSSTLFLRKLGEYATEEELMHLFESRCDGFERLKFVAATTDKDAMCFAKFQTVHHAEIAQASIDGYILHSCPSTPLQVEFAKNDLDMPKTQGKGGSGKADAHHGDGYSKGGSFHRQEHDYGASQGRGYSTHHGSQQGYRAAPPPSRGAASSVPMPKGANNAPCDTMFMTQIFESPEYEIEGALQTMPGFIRLKLINEGTDKCMAFALFDSVQAAAEGIEAFHGTSLPSAPHRAIMCDFAKNSLDKRSREAY
eukprot:gnl/TRDRNA2_/TRDRNA2_173799_c5_seq3.p1 gnl/TRDRNA2_/TRDRNA2_173799_c5~~gnl/TRDRNA2_/TRDRNA2_173799_c5_seq3.p1  ORF type:complete len:391 (+),score=71.90 gnl/TRDRNA2_/TRDRNA2_173799_c5_seq3:174-1346(+)